MKCQNSKAFVITNQALKYQTIFSSRNKGYGACLDTGAHTNFIARQEAKVYCNFIETKL